MTYYLNKIRPGFFIEEDIARIINRKSKKPERKNKISTAIEKYIVETTVASNGINSSRDVCNEIHRVFKKRISSASIRRLRQKHVC